uniref:nutritionally-regulated adipose and cardiac enriched protein homolog n=1 Tax=Halichoerus grypus TaxID=9711 RepID=UPI0016597707|nr:nutritionally-regulated adipose and cardiac enriched protein homolog [Halichoerus grypus]
MIIIIVTDTVGVGGARSWAAMNTAIRCDGPDGSVPAPTTREQPRSQAARLGQQVGQVHGGLHAPHRVPHSASLCINPEEAAGILAPGGSLLLTSLCLPPLPQEGDRRGPPSILRRSGPGCGSHGAEPQRTSRRVRFREPLEVTVHYIARREPTTTTTTTRAVHLGMAERELAPPGPQHLQNTAARAGTPGCAAHQPQGLCVP